MAACGNCTILVPAVVLPLQVTLVTVLGAVTGVTWVERFVELVKADCAVW